MDRSAYPEWGRREAMLFAVNEWIKDRPDPDQRLHYYEVAALVGGPAYEGTPTETGVQYDRQMIEKFQGEQINLFQSLVKQGYIDADLGHGIDGGPPFIRATVRDLTTKGYQLIEELPDPQQDLIRRLDAIAEAIRQSNAPEEEKAAAEKAADELKKFMRSVSPAVATQIITALARSHGLL